VASPPLTVEREQRAVDERVEEEGVDAARPLVLVHRLDARDRDEPEVEDAREEREHDHLARSRSRSRSQWSSPGWGGIAAGVR
jgi:hypothetical protein